MAQAREKMGMFRLSESSLNAGCKLRIPMCSLLSLGVPVGGSLVRLLETESNILGIWGAPKKLLKQRYPRVLVAAQPVVPVLLESPVIG